MEIDGAVSIILQIVPIEAWIGPDAHTYLLQVDLLTLVSNSSYTLMGTIITSADQLRERPPKAGRLGPLY